MSEVCSTCGLPKQLCVCETIAREEQIVHIKEEKRKFGKMITVISGIRDKNIDLREIAKKLKNRLACGGTAKDGQIELQGNHSRTAREELKKMGFQVE